MLQYNPHMALEECSDQAGIARASQDFIRNYVSGVPSDLSISGEEGALDYLDYLLYETVLREPETIRHAAIVWGEVLRQILGMHWTILPNGEERILCLRDGDINRTLIDPCAEVSSELLRPHKSFSSLLVTVLLTYALRGANERCKQAAFRYLSPFLDKTFVRNLSQVSE